MSIVWVLSETSLYHNKTGALSPFEGEGANSKRGGTGGAEDWWFYLSCVYVFRQLIRHSPKVQPETSQHRDDTLCRPPASCPYCVLERLLLTLEVAPRALVLVLGLWQPLIPAPERWWVGRTREGPEDCWWTWRACLREREGRSQPPWESRWGRQGWDH